MDTSGFYKKTEEGEWWYAPNFVIHKNYELYRENKDEYDYPVDGWEWYDREPIEYIESKLKTDENI